MTKESYFEELSYALRRRGLLTGGGGRPAFSGVEGQ